MTKKLNKAQIKALEGQKDIPGLLEALHINGTKHQCEIVTGLLNVCDRNNPQPGSELHSALKNELVNLLATAKDAKVLKWVLSLCQLTRPEINFEILLPLTRHRDWSVREYAVKSLKFTKDPRAIGTLKEILGNDPDREVRHAAMRTLGECGSEQDVDYIISCMQQGFDQGSCICALAEIGDVRSLQHLIDAFYAFDRGKSHFWPNILRGLEKIAKSATLDAESLQQIRDVLLKAEKSMNPEYKQLAAGMFESLGLSRESGGVPSRKSASVKNKLCPRCSRPLNYDRKVSAAMLGDQFEDLVSRTAYVCGHCGMPICRRCAETSTCTKCGNNQFNVAIE